MNKKGAVQWEIIVALVLFTGALLWMNFKKDTESNRFSDEAKQIQTTDKNYGLVNLSLLNGKGEKNCGSKINPCSVIIVPSSTISTPTPPIIIEPQTNLADSLGVSEKQLVSIGHLNFWERIGASIVIIVFVMLIGGLLDALGGEHWLFCRRYLMPFLLSVGVSTLVYIFHPVWFAWLAGIAVWPMMGTLTLPYSGDGNFGRAVWMFLSAAAGGILLVLSSYFFHCHLLAWWLYIIYLINCGVWGGKYRLWQQFEGDWWTGSCALCSLILFVYLTLQLSL